MTHEELVTRAARWLRNTMHCGVVLTEPTNVLLILVHRMRDMDD